MDTTVDLCIIGAQKAATTSLLNYLGEHSEISAHKEEEFTFFVDDCEYERKLHNVISEYYFDSLPKKNKLIVKSASMYKDKQSIARLYKHNPNCVVVFCCEIL